MYFFLWPKYGNALPADWINAFLFKMEAHFDCVALPTGSDNSGLLVGSTGSDYSTVAQMVEQAEQVEQVAVTIALDPVSCLACCLVV